MKRIPLTAKVLYSVFVAVLVPYYWVEYTPWNFLYFCDVALLMTLVGLWTESAWLVSLSAVGILAPQVVWVVDFVAHAVAGIRITGMTDYMFNDDIPLFVRGLSSFHGWLPFLLVWLLMRLGYDRRAVPAQPALAVTLLLVCFAFGPTGPPPEQFPNHAVNINYVHGMDDARPQTLMPPALWLLLLMGVNVGLFQLPTHVVLKRALPAARPSSPAGVLTDP
jgi:hypothetical protein